MAGGSSGARATPSEASAAVTPLPPIAAVRLRDEHGGSVDGGCGGGGRAGDADDPPLLTAAEEMQYHRALWVNRLLKEQVAAQTQGLTVREIEEAQEQIQARHRDVFRGDLLTDYRGGLPPRYRANAKSASTGPGFSPRPILGPLPPALIAPSAHNRRRQEQRIRKDNLSLLSRLQGVQSTLTARGSRASEVPKLSARGQHWS